MVKPGSVGGAMKKTTTKTKGAKATKDLDPKKPVKGGLLGPPDLY
jgi:hypothetical protein